jgi:O-antigen/teichoic acid export membrane protein
MALVGLLKGIDHLYRTVLLASGRSGRIFKNNFIDVFLTLSLVSLGFYLGGLIGIVVAFLCSSFFYSYLTIRATQFELNDKSFFWRTMGRTIIVSILMFGFVISISYLAKLEPVITLAIGVSSGIIIYTILRSYILTTDERKIVLLNKLYTSIYFPKIALSLVRKTNR